MITAIVNGQELTWNALKEWESKRLVVASRFLKRKLGYRQKITSSADFLKLKLETPEDNMRRALGRSLALSSLLTKAMTILSFGRRKQCVTEFIIHGCAAETLFHGFNRMMLDNTSENRANCLAACPDHYLLKGCKDHTQEVIEAAASMPLPLQFFVTYGDEEGLVTPKDSSYPFQAAGIARLKNGLAMGGVRHQMKDIPDGCAVRLTVEFPALLPNSSIKEHQLHLACEFYHWFDTLLVQTPEIQS
jgi:hypothetical protein